MKPFRNPDRCPERESHRLGPTNHLDWVEWSDEMSKTHEQALCPGCDRWVIWVPLEDPHPQHPAE